MTEPAPRFQFTGSLLPTSLYLERPADARLRAMLLAGQFCHVVAPRQIGKSSLRASTTRALRARGVRCVSLDLTTLGRPAGPDDWYFSLADEIANQLGHPEIAAFWDGRGGVTPALRLRDFLRHTLQRETDRRLVLMLDEIESVTLLDFPFDDFLPTLRSLFEARAGDPDLARLTICLIGVTSPSELIKDTNRTAYNVSEEVELVDFTRTQLGGLRPGFAGLDIDVDALLDAVYDWTAGQPYMTMKTCARIVDHPQLRRSNERAAVDAVVHDEFLDRPLQDPNLSYVARRFDDPKYAQRGASLPEKIELYRKVQAGEAVVVARESELQVELRLCGMVKVVAEADGEWLRPRNRVFQTVFDGAWLRARAQRRYLSEAVWAWLDCNRDPSALLLRGKLLEDAVAWARTNEPSKEEAEFLHASREQERHEIEARSAEIKREIARIESEKQAIEATYRQHVQRVRRTSWIFGVLVGVFLTVVIVGTILFQRKRASLTEEIAALTASRDDSEQELQRIQTELAAQRERSTAAANEFTSLETSRKATLADLKEKVTREQDLVDEVTEKQNQLDKQGKQFLTLTRDRKRLTDELTAAQRTADTARQRIEQTSSTLATTTHDLTTCTNRLAACERDTCLDCTAQLSACEQRVGSCPSDLERCRSYLEDCWQEARQKANACPAKLTACSDAQRRCLADKLGVATPSSRDLAACI